MTRDVPSFGRRTGICRSPRRPRGVGMLTRARNQPGVVGANLGITLAFALLAVIQLTRPSRSTRVEVISADVDDIDEELVNVPDLTRPAVSPKRSWPPPSRSRAGPTRSSSRRSIDGTVSNISATPRRSTAPSRGSGQPGAPSSRWCGHQRWRGRHQRPLRLGHRLGGRHRGRPRQRAHRGGRRRGRRPHEAAKRPSRATLTPSTAAPPSSTAGFASGRPAATARLGSAHLRSSTGTAPTSRCAPSSWCRR